MRLQYFIPIFGGAKVLFFLSRQTKAAKNRAI